MEFSKIGPRAILLRRKGRPPGDAAFAAPGDLTRHATGYFDMGTFPGCGGWHSLIGPDCDQRYKVQSEMHLAWFNGKLDLEKGGHQLFDNPAGHCGNVDGVLNFDELPAEYPALLKQRAALTAKQIFGNNRGFKLALKDRYPRRQRTTSHLAGLLREFRRAGNDPDLQAAASTLSRPASASPRLPSRAPGSRRRPGSPSRTA